MTGFIIDQQKLPHLFPTHKHSPIFWEKLGRAVASFGFLEEVLGRAIFAFTATRKYADNEIEQAYQTWLPQLMRALTDSLSNLVDSYGKVALDNPQVTTANINDLVEDLKKALVIRNVICHGSWQQPNANGASIPLYVDKKKGVFETPIDVAYLEQLQMHVAELACRVINTITLAGWRFPGTTGPGKPIA